MHGTGKKDFTATHVHGWTSPSEPPARGGRNLFVMKGVLATGSLLGLTPGKLFDDSIRTRFSYVTWRTAHFALTATLALCGKIFLSAPGSSSVPERDTATSLAESLPDIFETLCYPILLAWAFVRAPVTTRLTREVLALAQEAPFSSLTDQVVSLAVWLASGLAMATRFLNFIFIISTCGEVELSHVAWSAVNIYMTVASTWYLEFHIQLLILLRIRIQHLKDQLAKSLRPGLTGWIGMDSGPIVGSILECRRTSRLASRFLAAMSPVLLLFVTASFVRITCSLHIFGLIILIEQNAKWTTGLEVLSLLTYFLLLLTWNDIGKQVTAVPLCQVTAQVREHLLTFLRQLPDLTPVASASGFFVVAKPLLVTMTNCMATYFIFIVQFFDTAGEQDLHYGYFHGNRSCGLGDTEKVE
ncbi:hypothetical protein C7M84_000237 [Penaeus vannamei]|uniref:Gustatory receptor n=1 Tax=Penaeus vannamei TaxID=6689 RepID=A0A3R7PSB1_PENVA|nr:hypothetical protein C7M84_000237 [Penaeus vannamei]